MFNSSFRYICDLIKTWYYIYSIVFLHPHMMVNRQWKATWLVYYYGVRNRNSNRILNQQTYCWTSTVSLNFYLTRILKIWTNSIRSTKVFQVIQNGMHSFSDAVVIRTFLDHVCRGIPIFHVIWIGIANVFDYLRLDCNLYFSMGKLFCVVLLMMLTAILSADAFLAGGAGTGKRSKEVSLINRK